MSKGMITSIIFNVLLLAGIITLFLGKGINVVNHEHIHNHQEQFQGQLMMNFMLHKGDKIEWKLKKFKSNEELIDFLAALPPQESYFAKVVSPGYPGWIIYPKLFTEKK